MPKEKYERYKIGSLFISPIRMYNSALFVRCYRDEDGVMCVYFYPYDINEKPIIFTGEEAEGIVKILDDNFLHFQPDPIESFTPDDFKQITGE